MHKFSAIIAGLFFLNAISPATSNNNSFKVADYNKALENARVATFELKLSDTYTGGICRIQVWIMKFSEKP